VIGGLNSRHQSYSKSRGPKMSTPIETEPQAAVIYGSMAGK
jgi:hypothetical protein